MTQSINKTDLFATLPPEWPDSLLPRIQAQIADGGHKLVVLDDDPTGTQTVYDIPVLTEWGVDVLAAELANDLPAFYILTNSRSLPLTAAKALNIEIAQNLVAASKQSGREFAVVSRSDSTLRGHYPGEVDALTDALGQEVDACLLIPFFLEGGRHTINDVHYVAEGENLIPAAETPFAQDAAFGYKASNLREWVVEKTNGRIKPRQISSISLDDIRTGGPDRVAAQLATLEGGGVCVINASTMRDQEIFVAGLLTAEAEGKRFIYRTAASFVQARLGLATRSILTRADLGNENNRNGGLIVVGSYVPKTTSQVETLLARGTVNALEVSVDALLDDVQQSTEILRVVTNMNESLGRGEDTMIYTSRKLVRVDDAEQSLAIGNRVSESLVRIVQSIRTRPRYLLAKGGITSSDVATRGLSVKRAMVMGQILPGVPMWQMGDESRFPGMPYIVFPGNVGDENAVADVVETLSASA